MSVPVKGFRGVGTNLMRTIILVKDVREYREKKCAHP